MIASPTVELLAIGNELLRGEIQDTNTHWICRLVSSRGGRVERVAMLPDQSGVIAAEVRSAIARQVGVLLTSGGLGPTADDLTLAAVAEGAGLAMRLHPAALQMVRERYDTYHAQGIMAEGGLNPFREKMAWLPQGAEPLHNPAGTAPGVLLRTGSTTIISLPGVPDELKAILTTSLEPFLKQSFGQGGSLTRTLTVGCNDESVMEPVISRLIPRYPQVYIKSLARTLGQTPELDIILTIASDDEEKRATVLDIVLAELMAGLTEIGIGYRLSG
jgi:molybdenum cofactor synthesis domain-containing protein